MNRLTNMEKSVFGTSGSTTDANRLYSILLDTRASSESQNMYDIAEKLTNNERDNSKYALDQLWALKKNLSDENRSDTIDLLINFYQSKLDVIRSKEEDIKKVGKDSRELLEEKRKRDAEIVTVKQEIEDCETEIEQLQNKMSELKVKEQELILIDGELQKELKLNANEVVNNLYEIIISSSESADVSPVPHREQQVDYGSSDTIEDIRTEKVSETGDTERMNEEDIRNAISGRPIASEESEKGIKGYTPGPEIKKVEAVAPFPKSIVKTTRGVVIGEYYYDPKVLKNKRHYIFNSTFFYKSLSYATEKLEQRYDKRIHAETVQMIQDAYKRISESVTLHFEISTNEISNKNSLKELWHNMARKEYDDVLKMSNRLKAKIDALGNNYMIMLTEQMKRYCGSE